MTMGKAQVIAQDRHWWRRDIVALTLYTLMTSLSAMVKLLMTRFDAVVILLTTT